MTGAAFPSVATAAALPAAAANAGKAYWVTDTAVIMVSDGALWRTAYGDTGLRNVGAQMTHPSIEQTAPAPVGRLRRYGNSVLFYCDFKSTAAPASPFAMYTLPAGFRPDISGMYGVLRGYAGYNAVVMGGAGAVNVYGFPASTQERYVGNWFTQEAWPTVLPGTAIYNPN